MAQAQFQIGSYRPIYLWGGPGTIRMNRVKFMNQQVNEIAHHEVHDLSGAKKVVEEIYSNWIHLMFDWGFPPEIQQEDWEDFKKGCDIYHQFGVKVFAYIQTSNCVYQGSYQDKDWYAVDARGRKVFYYTDRYMANLLHPEWQAHKKELIARAIAYGADGIFFDNLWDGAMPVSMVGTWLGNAGSYDEISQQQYQASSGKSIPLDVSQDTPEVREYLEWRIRKVTSVVQAFADHARAIKPDVVIGANDFDMVMRNSPLIYGLDLEDQAQIQDVTMIENFGIPKWEEEKQVLVNNAQTIRVAREMVKQDAHLSILSYDDGIGWDGMYSPRRFRQTIAEAAACGVTNTIKGTEYYDEHQHTMLTATGFEIQRGAIGQYQHWLEQHSELLTGDRKNLADVVLLYPQEELVYHWHTIAPLFFGVGQTLLKAGIPWRVVRSGEETTEAATVLAFTEADHNKHKHALFVPDFPGWSAIAATTRFAQSAFWRNFLAGVIEPLWHGYFSSKFIRRIVDGLRLFKLFTGTALFDLPEAGLQKALLDQLTSRSPCLSADAPVLVEGWQQGEIRQYHLVNYADRPQSLKLDFPAPVKATLVSPDVDSERVLESKTLEFELNVYTIILVKEAD